MLAQSINPLFLEPNGTSVRPELLMSAALSESAYRPPQSGISSARDIPAVGWCGGTDDADTGKN